MSFRLLLWCYHVHFPCYSVIMSIKQKQKTKKQKNKKKTNKQKKKKQTKKKKKKDFCRVTKLSKQCSLVGLSKGPDPPDNPTRTERFWTGLKIFGLGFRSKFRVIFGFGSVSGLLYMQILNPILKKKKKKNPTLCWFLSASLSSLPVLSLLLNLWATSTNSLSKLLD